jgi:hypothetical protein
LFSFWSDETHYFDKGTSSRAQQEPEEEENKKSNYRVTFLFGRIATFPFSPL